MICISIYTDRMIPFQAVILSDTPSNNVMCCEGDRVVVAVAVAGVSSAEHVAAAGAIVVAQVLSLLLSKR